MPGVWDLEAWVTLPGAGTVQPGQWPCTHHLVISPSRTAVLLPVTTGTAVTAESPSERLRSSCLQVSSSFCVALWHSLQLLDRYSDCESPMAVGTVCLQVLGGTGNATGDSCGQDLQGPRSGKSGVARPLHVSWPQGQDSCRVTVSWGGL